MNHKPTGCCTTPSIAPSTAGRSDYVGPAEALFGGHNHSNYGAFWARSFSPFRKGKGVKPRTVLKWWEISMKKGTIVTALKINDRCQIHLRVLIKNSSRGSASNFQNGASLKFEDCSKMESLAVWAFNDFILSNQNQNDHRGCKNPICTVLRIQKS